MQKIKDLGTNLNNFKYFFKFVLKIYFLSYFLKIIKFRC